MRKKIVIPILIILCLGMFLIFSFRSKLEPQPESSFPDEPQITENAKSSVTTQRQSSAVGNLQSAGRSAESPLIPTNAAENYFQQFHRPIQFYGKVVDENEQPIAGANIKFIWTQFHPEASYETNVLSDANGLFSLGNATGKGLEAYVEKSGYYPVKSRNENYYEFSGMRGPPFQPDPINPVIFYLRKKGPGVDLLTSQHGMSPELTISGLRDGTPLRVDFFSKKMGGVGQLELSAIKPRQGEPVTGWSFRMSIPEGGFVEYNDEFPFQAPETGYQPTVEFHFKPGETNWTNRLSKDYYIVFGQPPKYGRIHVETGIYQGVRLQYAINPEGSRDLEPKEYKPPEPELAPGVIRKLPN
jgi:hypothetical protein